MQALINELQSLIGENLRSVAEYTQDDYTIHYSRDDISAAYTDEEREKIYDDLILEGIATRRLESLFHVGPFNCTMYSFEDAHLFHFPRDDYSGIIVSIDASTDVTLAAFIERCLKELN